MEDKSRQLVQMISEMQEEDAVKLAREMLDSGYDPVKLLGHCREAMEAVGKRYEEGEYFLPELMLAGEMLKAIGDMAKPLIKQGAEGAKTVGTIVLGTVQGDLHDIGKNIVTFMLEINGFKVIDLGIDVPVENFIESIKQNKPEVVGLSGFLTLAFDAMKQTIEAIKAAGLRENTKIMIGGGQVDETIKTYTGADAFGLNAMDAVSLCKRWMPA
ncbi:MAG TPA: cobalamin-dependent protein [Candidatus Acidoferrales bacterium]|nr:cobalamin-dependent protein [Candidatus Acidoferrales bacterium]